MKSSFGLLVLILSIGAARVSAAESSRISILSLLRPTKLVLTVKDQNSLLLLENSAAASTSHLSGSSILPVELEANSLLIQSQFAQKASIRCTGGCQLL